MKATLLTVLPVKYLEYVFSPPGLPLPAKGESDQGTTSILVRGGAGTGKTTFALGLAHAAAKAGGGLVLYLTTEFSPVEITFKATLIGLPEDIVEVWPGTEGATPGGVVVEHLSVLRQGRPVLSSAERKRGVIDAVWGLLHPEKEGEQQPPLPVRAVVIDALTLPEAGESEGALRADLVAFVQALESEGISVVLVEELAPGTSAWSSFVVDVVFELSFQPDPETHDLRRKLTLSKCRYALSIPGPHDYGLDDGAPGVWPDIFRVVTLAHAAAETPLFSAVPPRLMLPADSEGKWTLLHASVVLSPFDQTSHQALRVLWRTPGAKELSIRCGARTIGATASIEFHVDEDDGINAIGWNALYCAKTTGANLCGFSDLERFLSRPDSAARVRRLLEALRLMGFMVFVHSPLVAMEPLRAVADHVWGGSKSRMFTRPPPRQRRLARQCLGVAWIKESRPLTRALSELNDARDIATLQAARNKAHAAVAPGPAGLTAIELLRLCTVQERSGSKIDKSRLKSLLNADGADGHQAAWLALHTGFDWHASGVALAAVESDTPDPTLLLLWKAICAAVAQNLAAIDELKALLASPDEALILDPLLRGLGATNQFGEADRIIADVGTRHALAPWMLDRLRADARLESGNDATLRDAVERFTALIADESIPLIDQAEAWHNLGTAQDRLHQRDAALAAFERASALNPLLDVAREELERLRAPKPAS